MLSSPNYRLAMIAILFAGFCGHVGCDRRPKWNIVIITMDTTRVDRLGAYGYAGARTPAIDALAREGFLFENHLTPVPITLPSHTTLMTGHYPPTHSVRDNGIFTVPDGEVTLAEVLGSHGYDTSAFVASFPLHSRFNLDQGFARYDDRFEDRYRDLDGYRIKAQAGIYFDERPAADVVNAAIDYHRDRKGKPFFTFLHFFDPHQPQSPPSPFDVDFREQPYDGEIAYVDSQLKRFFDFLKDRGEWDNTIVVLTADHGEGLGEHNELTHAILLHQATLHIPLIIKGPGIAPGRTAHRTDSTQILATLLDLLGIDSPATEIPISPGLGPILANQPDVTELPAFYCETLAPRTSQGWAQLSGLTMAGQRYIHGPNALLYDLTKDPDEKDNLFAERPEETSRLMNELRHFLTQKETVPAGDALQTLDPETMERLAALGYVGDGLHSMTGMKDFLDYGDLPDPYQLVMEISTFSEAKAAFSKGNYGVAEKMFERLYRDSPKHTSALRSLAMIRALRGDWDAAFEYMKILLEASPNDREVSALAGQLLVQSGQVERGIEALRKVPEAEKSLPVCIWLGRALDDVNAVEEAEVWYSRGLALEPHHPWISLYLANLKASTGHLDLAEPIYLDLIQHNPYFFLAYYNYGLMLIDRGDNARARGLLERAALLNPDHQMTRETLARLDQDGQ